MSGHNAINVSRPLLEATVRARLLELPNVQLVDGCDVLGLLVTPDAARVSGVRLIRRRADSAEESLAADQRAGPVALIAAASPEQPRGGVLLSQEGNRWIVTAAGYLGAQAPLTHAGLLEYVGGTAAPAIYEVLKDAEPLSEPVAYKICAGHRRSRL